MPFWKKTSKGGKKKPPKPTVPRTAQQSIPMQRMFEDGTCRVKPNYYTRTIQYQDINYQLAQQALRSACASAQTAAYCAYRSFSKTGSWVTPPFISSA